MRYGLCDMQWYKKESMLGNEAGQGCRKYTLTVHSDPTLYLDLS
jgi:hypothetical protein